MTSRKRVTAEAVDAEAVKVGDTVKLKGGSGLVVLPDYSVVTARSSYTFQHEGRHEVGGVEYDATDPRKAAEPVDPDAPQD